MSNFRSQAASLILVVVCGLVLGGCAQRKSTFDARASQSAAEPGSGAQFTELSVSNRIQPQWLVPPTNYYKVGPGDLLEFDLQSDKLERVQATVGPDGKVYVSLLPGVFVWGKTLAECEQLIQDELGKFIRVKPEVSTSLKAANSQRFWIMGSVANPGVYSLATPVNVVGALAQAGGLLQAPTTSEPTVDLKNSFILRDGERLPVDLDRLFNHGDLGQNIYLAPGDYVYIKSATARQVYVLGAVQRAAVVPYGPNLTLMNAIANAGGAAEYAYLGHVAILRGTLNSPKIAIVDFTAIGRGKATDVKLEAGDVVYVPFAPYRKLALFGERILGTFVNSIAVNEGRRAVILGAEPTQISLPFSGGGGGVGF